MNSKNPGILTSIIFLPYKLDKYLNNVLLTPDYSLNLLISIPSNGICNTLKPSN